MSDLKLSVLDLATIYNGNSVTETLRMSTKLAQLADRLGYTRYWFAEHHNSKHQASSAPEVLIAHTAALTERIRVGSGGVMIPNHSALKVAENFSLLEGLHPGRIDLGIGRAPGTDGRTAIALRRSREGASTSEVSRQLDDLISYFTREFPEKHPFRNIIPSPDPSLVPELFMLGSSDGGMKIASQLGWGYAFAAQINPQWAVQILRGYRNNFRPSRFRSEPYSIMSIIVICADTDEEAEYLAGPARLQWARWNSGQFQYAPPTLEEAANHVFSVEERIADEHGKERFVIGKPETVKARLQELAEKAFLDEIMILNMIPDEQARHRSLELLAKEFGL
ncbi:LLM class flavin-dependent oxidoreductase [Aciduricibacillus chroicocephali]|uniref:LLM class flavin-dependent oxidoreductase n=1 Tax=Aciduricibacillus chroicocephali TaxID=3054939 RepID=A0ABY9KVD3_9BACI|nr:LLM class flavin-dependent oxidoreductase [Bacillaceae bacterium 44XB]